MDNQSSSRPNDRPDPVPAKLVADSYEALTEHLSVGQVNVIGLLSSGKSLVEAAELAGVNRSTIYRWFQTDPYFRCAYELWCREMKTSTKAQVLKVAHDHVPGCIRTALEAGNARLALDLFKLV